MSFSLPPWQALTIFFLPGLSDGTGELHFMEDLLAMLLFLWRHIALLAVYSLVDIVCAGYCLCCFHRFVNLDVTFAFVVLLTN
jgi:hypothetical protein